MSNRNYVKVYTTVKEEKKKYLEFIVGWGYILLVRLKQTKMLLSIFYGFLLCRNMKICYILYIFMLSSFKKYKNMLHFLKKNRKFVLITS